VSEEKKKRRRREEEEKKNVQENRMRWRWRRPNEGISCIVGDSRMNLRQEGGRGGRGREG
jgi:hypothetical protein